jgi:hypothetical protein
MVDMNPGWFYSGRSIGSPLGQVNETRRVILAAPDRYCDRNVTTSTGACEPASRLRYTCSAS